MDQIKAARQHLIDSDDIFRVLAASWRAFELLRVVTRASADQAADMYPAFTFARGAAVGGRNAVTFSPSFRAECATSPSVPGEIALDVYEVADAAAELAAVLSECLREASATAADAGDRAACEIAADHAERISALLAKAD